MRPSLFSAILFAQALVLCRGGAVAADVPSRAVTWEGGGTGRGTIQHLRFVDREWKFRLPEGWTVLDGEGNGGVRLLCHYAPRAWIEIGAAPLTEAPKNAEAAAAFYGKLHATRAERMVVRRARADERYSPSQALFQNTFNEAREGKTELTRYTTYFVISNRVYHAVLDNPDRTEISRTLNDYSTILRTFEVHPRTAPSSPGAKGP